MQIVLALHDYNKAGALSGLSWRAYTPMLLVLPPRSNWQGWSRVLFMYVLGQQGLMLVLLSAFELAHEISDSWLGVSPAGKIPGYPIRVPGY